MIMITTMMILMNDYDIESINNHDNDTEET